MSLLKYQELYIKFFIRCSSFINFHYILHGANTLNGYSSIGYEEMKKVINCHQVEENHSHALSLSSFETFSSFFSSPNFLGILLSSYFCVQILMRDSFHLHENFNGRSCLLFYFFFANFSFSTIYPLIFSGKRHEFHIVPFKKIFFQIKDFVDNFTVIYCQCL